MKSILLRLVRALLRATVACLVVICFYQNAINEDTLENMKDSERNLQKFFATQHFDNDKLRAEFLEGKDIMIYHNLDARVAFMCVCDETGKIIQAYPPSDEILGRYVTGINFKDDFIKSPYKLGDVVPSFADNEPPMAFYVTQLTPTRYLAEAFPVTQIDNMLQGTMFAQTVVLINDKGFVFSNFEGLHNNIEHNVDNIYRLTEEQMQEIRSYNDESDVKKVNGRYYSVYPHKMTTPQTSYYIVAVYNPYKLGVLLGQVWTTLFIYAWINWYWLWLQLKIRCIAVKNKLKGRCI